MVRMANLAVVAWCLLVPSALAQITFSRSWVPQGKRSPTLPGDMLSVQHQQEQTAHALLDPTCKDAKMAVLSQLASHLTELMEETAEEAGDDTALAYRLKHAMGVRRRRMT